MKALLGKLRISRKLLLIMTGFLALCGGTGAAAVYIGTDALLGPSYKDLNGLTCTEVQSVEIRKKDRHWVRKYITTEASDGETRVKTALRVAQTVYAADKPDLVQVVVLAADGPSDRAEMRGRAIGADVLYVPDPTRVPEHSKDVFTARYVDATTSTGGRFYGEKIDIPSKEVAALFARLNDNTNCLTPKLDDAAADPHAPAGHEAPAAHGADAEGHGADAASEDAGHGAPAGHGDAAGHGEPAGHGAPAGHGEAATDGHSTPDAEAKDGGLMSSVLGMVGLGGKAAPAAPDAAPAHADVPAAHMPAADADVPATHADMPDHAAAEHGAPPVEAASAHHGSETLPAPAPVHDNPAAAGHGPDAGMAAPHQAADALPPQGQPEAPEAPAAGPEADGEGWFSKIKSMVMAGAQKGADQPIDAAGTDGAGTADAPIDLNESAADADAAGADWLAKFKSKPVKATSETQAHTQAETHPEVPAEDSDGLPHAPQPAKPDEHAEAGH